MRLLFAAFALVALASVALAKGGAQSEMSNRVAEVVFTAAQLPPFTRDPQPNASAYRSWQVTFDIAFVSGTISFTHQGVTSSDATYVAQTAEEWRADLQTAVRTIPALASAVVYLNTDYTLYTIAIPYDMTLSDIMTITDGMVGGGGTSIAALYVSPTTNAAGAEFHVRVGDVTGIEYYANAMAAADGRPDQAALEALAVLWCPVENSNACYL